MDDSPLAPNVIAYLETLDGWCSPQKAQAIATLLRDMEPAPHTCVEIGVYGARSLIPQALMLQARGAGVIYGIDPWTKMAVVEGTNDPENDKWWTTVVDLEEIHAKAMKAITALDLWRHVRIIAAPAQDVAQVFPLQSIDVLHLDGNHSQLCSCRDLSLYLPRVRTDGYIILDDTAWPTMQAAVGMMDTEAELIQAHDNWRIYRKSKKR